MNQNTMIFEKYYNTSDNKAATQINKRTEKNKEIKEYSIQFQQLKAYFNFKRRLDTSLNKISINNNFTKCYLIDKNWFRNWKKHIEYEEFKNLYDMYSLDREIYDKDSGWIEPIVTKNKNDKLFSPLDNTKIFHDNNINPLADFVIVDEECYKLFSSERKEGDYGLSIDKSFPIKNFYQKIIVQLSNVIYLIIFPSNMPFHKDSRLSDGRNKPNFDKLIYFELLIVIKEENSYKENFIKDLEEKDMNKWIKESNIDIYHINDEKLYSKNGINFTIINKTLKSYQRKKYMKNEFKERQELILAFQQKTSSLNMQNQLSSIMINNFQKIGKRKDDNNSIVHKEINDNLLFFLMINLNKILLLKYYNIFLF